MALLRTRGGGLLATGPDAVRANAMRQQQMALQAAAPPRVISAPRPILEENPLNTIGTGLASLGKSLTATAGLRREQAARQALEAAGNDMNRLMEVARRFPATNAGKAAGLQVKNAFDMRATTTQLEIDAFRAQAAAQAAGQPKKFDAASILSGFGGKNFNTLSPAQQYQVGLAQSLLAQPRPTGEFDALTNKPIMAPGVPFNVTRLPGQGDQTAPQVPPGAAAPVSPVQTTPLPPPTGASSSVPTAPAEQAPATPALATPAPARPGTPPPDISDQQPVASVDPTIVKQVDDLIATKAKAESELEQLMRAVELNNVIPEGAFARILDKVAGVGAPVAQARQVREFNNIVLSQAIQNLKELFGGQLSEGEREAFLDLQALANQPKEVRARILKKVTTALRRVINQSQTRIEDLQAGRVMPREAPTALITMSPDEIMQAPIQELLNMAGETRLRALSEAQRRALRTRMERAQGANQ